MRPRIWQGGSLLVAGVALDGGAAAVFNGRWRPPELLYWFGWPGFLLPGLLASAVGLALLVGRPRGWYDGAVERLTPAATRVATSAAWIVSYVSAAAGLYFVIAMTVEERSPPCLDASCSLFGLAVASVLGVVALVGLPAAVLLFGLAQVLRAPGVPVR